MTTEYEVLKQSLDYHLNRKIEAHLNVVWVRLLKFWQTLHCMRNVDLKKEKNLQLGQKFLSWEWDFLGAVTNYFVLWSAAYTYHKNMVIQFCLWFRKHSKVELLNKNTLKKNLSSPTEREIHNFPELQLTCTVSLE